jgi:hypothetical protein
MLGELGSHPGKGAIVSPKFTSTGASDATIFRKWVFAKSSKDEVIQDHDWALRGESTVTQAVHQARMEQRWSNATSQGGGMEPT